MGHSMFTNCQYLILKQLSRGEPNVLEEGSVYAGKSKVRTLLGDALFRDIQGHTVVDFGCGDGHEAIEMAMNGARKVIGVDIRESALANARQHARQAGVEKKCVFTTRVNEQVDRIVSLDAFEHFEDPAAILKVMGDILPPGGAVVASFGPTWYHPLGGHLFSVFPWAHILFSEKALIRWRNDIRNDGATKFEEVEGGLNQMTIRRFERLVAESPFHLKFLEAVPIRKLRFLHYQLTREFTTAIVRCQLVKKA